MTIAATDYDYAVVGGGIAGLAIAEIFARSGHSVVLLERNKLLCNEASASQHGWFHFGSLYSIFPQNQFLRTMIGGVEDLLDYYASFRGMNIRVTHDGHLSFPQEKGAWFRDEPIEYIVCARNAPDFDLRSFHSVREYSKKLFFVLTWEMAIKQFISRHQRFHKHNWRGAIPASRWIPRAGWTDYSRAVITKPDNPGVKLDPNTHFRVVGFDRPMHATTIISDLIRSLLGSGGEVKTGIEVERVEKTPGGVRVHTNAGRIMARRVIITTGKWLGHFLERPADVKVVGSPLLVAYPAVSETNFVRMTPFVEASINHLHHQVGGVPYSLIGGGQYVDPEDPNAVSRASDRLVSMAKSIFPRLGEAKVLETYLGYKAEIVGRGAERNYQYFIREIGQNVFVAVPGKFSLAFSLAVNTFKRLAGKEPIKELLLKSHDAAQRYVGLTRHADAVIKALPGDQRPKDQKCCA